MLDEWNGNGCLVVAHFPADLAKRMPEAKAWAGQIAEQFGIERPAQYLEGGGKQLVIDMGKFAEHINVVGERVKETEKAESLMIDGVRMEFFPTHWTNVEDVYGYSKFSSTTHGAVKTRRLASDEIQTKVTNAKATAGLRVESANEERAQ